MKQDRLFVATLASGALAAAIGAYHAWRLLMESWTHEADVTAVRPLLVTSALLAAASLLIAASLLLRPALRANVALALASIAATTYAVEMLLAFRRTPAHKRFEEKLALLDELRSRGESAYAGIAPSSFVRATFGPAALAIDGSDVLPLAGVGGRLTVDCQEGDGEWLIYRADPHGFHNPPGIWGGTPLQVAAVGDSFTMGACVGSDENFVAHLRRRFEATLNLGVAGSGPLIMLALLREYLEPLRPQLVLWCHYAGNDLLDLRKEMGHPILVRYLDEGFTQGLVAKQDRLDAALADYTERYLTPALRERARPRPAAGDVLALKRLRERLGLLLADPYGLAPTEGEERMFGTILGKAKATVESWGGRLVFVNLPPWSEPPRQLGEVEHLRIQERARRNALKTAGALGLQVIHVEEAFRTHPDPKRLFACPGCHYAPDGYLLAARTIMAALEPPATRE